MVDFQPALCGLLPHPPIVVPEIGNERLDACRSTFAACTEFARRLVESRPARLFLVSPHSPRRSGAFGLWSGRRLHGDLAQFGAPGTEVDLENDRELAEGIARGAGDGGLATWWIPSEELDHGVTVPLTFLVRAGWSGPTCVASLPWSSDREELLRFGQAAARALERLEGRPALVASGDMTHRAEKGAPAGYHPRAVEFDRALTVLVERGELEGIARIDADLRELAAEDAVESCAIVAASLGHRSSGAEVLSYEHPFGVGYLVAVFHDGKAGGRGQGLAPLVAVAREAIRARLEGRAPRGLPAPRGELERRAGVFVTLRTPAGELRGCIGTSAPTLSDLVAETTDRARAAAFEDPRFPPLARGELDAISIEVSVLGPLETVPSKEDLDPRRFGVVVRDGMGRTGLLLPDLEGIDTPEQQISIALGKAQIPPATEIVLKRFTVEKVREEPA